MLIRTATPAHIPQLIALELQTDTAAHWSAREYDALFAPEAPERLTLVACDDAQPETIVGFLIARCLPEEWEIENLIVHVAHQRRGAASRLVRELLQRAGTRGVTSVLLEVRESNLPARRLYEKLGFSEDGRRAHYYREPYEDALLLRFLLQKGDKTP